MNTEIFLNTSKVYNFTDGSVLTLYKCACGSIVGKTKDTASGTGKVSCTKCGREIKVEGVENGKYSRYM